MTEMGNVSTNAVLAHLKARLSAAASPAANLQEADWQAQWNLRGNPNDTDFMAAVEASLGMGLPLTPNKIEDQDSVLILWLGPDEWMITSGDSAALASKIDALKDALKDQHHALTDVSDNRTLLQLSGPAAKDILAAGCGLDMRHWQVGDCAQTHFSRAQIILAQIDDAPTFNIYVRNSFADYLAQFMLLEIEDLS